MKGKASRSLVRVGTLVAMLAIVLGAASCGGSDDAGTTSGAEQVTQVLEEMGAKMEAGDATGACALMTDRGRRELVAQAGGLPLGASEASLGGSCEKVFGALLTSGEMVEDLRPEILAIEINGDSAAVTANSSRDDQPQTARLVKEDGKWRVATWYAN